MDTFRNFFKLLQKKHTGNIFLPEYAVGDTGLIVSTTYGGTDRIIQNSGTTKRLNCGLILKTFTGGLVEITKQHEVIPSDFILHRIIRIRLITVLRSDSISPGIISINLKFITTLVKR